MTKGGDATKMSGQGNAGGWPSTTGNPSGGGRSNNGSNGGSNVPGFMTIDQTLLNVGALGTLDAVRAEEVRLGLRPSQVMTWLTAKSYASR